MGKYKFRLSDMIPNAWFYKLKYMSNHGGSKKNLHVRKNPATSSSTNTPTKHCKSPQLARNIQPNRASYHISSRPEPHKLSNSSNSPRKSTKRSRRKLRHKNYKNVVLNGDATEFNSATSPETPAKKRDDFVDEEFESLRSWSSSSSCTVTTSATDIIIDISSKSSAAKKLDDFDSSLELPPIQTKLMRKEAEQPKFVDKNIDSSKTFSSTKRSPTDFRRLRIRPNSPRLVVKRRSNVSEKKTRGISDSFAVVKSSENPQSDFKESMMEMIVENDLCKSKDLEDLLACYLTLNSDEYHDVIIKVFKQIWFDVSRIKS